MLSISARLESDNPALFGDFGWPFDGDIGANFIAFSKALGRSFAPGGNCFLLGLPEGVCVGLVKPFCVGVEGRSKYSFPERVCKSGGGIGIFKSGLLVGERGVLTAIVVDLR